MAQQILIIEPDKLLAETYQQSLQSAGHKVRVAADAQNAIHDIDKKRPDLIILEVQLGEHNGVEFLYELRSYGEWTNIPVIVLSQLPEADIGFSRTVKDKLGIRAYHYKPATNLAHLCESVELVSA
jgi:DNA-binding response OmpR family regulator